MSTVPVRQEGNAIVPSAPSPVLTTLKVPVVDSGDVPAATGLEGHCCWVEGEITGLLFSDDSSWQDVLFASHIGSTIQAYDADLTTWAGITPGTGVATALATNVGTAGAFVVLNGAGGTPSAITLTNGTGLPIAGLAASTSTPIGVGSIELGHASDTTFTRSAAGIATIEGDRILTVTKEYAGKIVGGSSDSGSSTRSSGSVGDLASGVQSITFTLAAAANVEIYVKADTYNDMAPAYIYLYADVDGTDYQLSSEYRVVAYGPAGQNGSRIFALGSGSHTIKIQYDSNIGTITATNRYIKATIAP